MYVNAYGVHILTGYRLAVKYAIDKNLSRTRLRDNSQTFGGMRRRLNVKANVDPGLNSIDSV